MLTPTFQPDLSRRIVNKGQGFALAGLAFVGLFVIRDAVVRASMPDRPAHALLVWPGHPDALIAERMTAIGQAAAAKRPVDESLTGPVIEAVRRSPMRIEPFLVAAVKAQTSGHEALAGPLLVAAALRDPRATAPHLFLSAHYQKIGQPTQSLTELGRLIHLVPDSAGALAPKIAEVVKQAGGPGMVRALVAQNPELRDNVMRALATDAANLNYVLSLRTSQSSKDWVPVMTASLVVAGQYDRAVALWASANQVALANRPSIFDPGFKLDVPPPFGWTVGIGTAGEAVADPAGGLHLTSYGGEAAGIVSQTALLAPGTYLFTQKVSSGSGDPAVLSWQFTCLGTQRKIGSVAIGQGGAKGRIEVPGDCRAQQVALISTPGEMPETLDVTLSPIDLSRVP